MKIEKVNDNQIRCTLTKADLADRELKLSEIAYGTEKAKNLFKKELLKILILVILNISIIMMATIS